MIDYRNSEGSDIRNLKSEVERLTKALSASRAHPVDASTDDSVGGWGGDATTRVAVQRGHTDSQTDARGDEHRVQGGVPDREAERGREGSRLQQDNRLLGENKMLRAQLAQGSTRGEA